MKIDLGAHISTSQPPSNAAIRARRRKPRRARSAAGLALEALEPRVVLSQIMWDTSAAPTGGDWDMPNNWIGGAVPASGDSAIIQGLTGAGTVLLQSNLADSVASLNTDSSVTLEVTNGSLSIGA